MKSRNSVNHECSYRRFVIQHDPLIGYRFIPNIYSRVKYLNNSFVIQTNKQGFRDNVSFDKRDSGKSTVLALGDSYLAGDSICNHERFMNIMAERFDINVLNMGLPGSGSDQQLLIQEHIASQWQYDILVIVAFLHNLKRNLKSKMNVRDWVTKRNLDIGKPYFKLIEAKTLKLCGVPVPKAKNLFIGEKIDLDQRLRGLIRESFPFTHKQLGRLKGTYMNFAYHTKIKKADSEYCDETDYGWQLMRAIFERMIQNAGTRPVVIIPIPVNAHIRFGAHPYYLDRFHELTRPNVHLVDVLPSLKSAYKKEREELFVPDGHLSAMAHEIIADACSPLFSKLTGNHNRKPIKSPKKKVENHKYILGISCYYHDSAAAIIKDGEIIAAAQEERFTRVKHDKSFPVNAINYCLEEARISERNLDAVVYYDNELLTLERMVATQLYIGPRNKRLLRNSLPHWVSTKFSVWSHIRRELDYSGPLFRAFHHQSHAASAFYPSPFEEAAIVTVDGVGEWATTTIGIGEANKISVLKEQRFPHSLGLLYSAFASFCGFKVNSGEYKLMGLAPYGSLRYKDRILENLIEMKQDGSFKLNLRYFAFLEGKRMTNGHFEDLFDGPPRQPESSITQRECDLASSIQNAIEEIMLRIVNYAHDQTGKENLVLAGGVALNCVANGRILREGPFRDMWIQPAAGDAGGALGAALGLWYGTWNNPRKIGRSDQKDSCFGPSFSDAEIKAYLDFHNYKYHKLTKQNRADVIADYLINGKIVGHFSGCMEFGPRALGSRSILADPRDTEMQRILNLKIKYRESFRPFAPIVLEERNSEYFEIDRPSPYMLLVALVKDDIRIAAPEEQNSDILARLKHKRSSIPAVTHIDYSARIQSVSKKRYPELYDILRTFEQKTGCGVLVNTSFNVRGEPIVCTPEDAHRCFMRTEMDILVIDNFLLKKEEQPAWKEEKDWRTVYELD